MAEEVVTVETGTKAGDEKGLLWFLSEMHLWKLKEMGTSGSTPTEAYDPERLGKLRKTAATIGAGEASVMAAGIPAVYACVKGILHPFAGELPEPWVHVVFGLVTLWPVLVTTTVLWFSLTKIEGDVTAMIAKNFALLRGLVLAGGAALAATFQAVILPKLIGPETIYSCPFLPKTLALNGYLFWRNFLGVLAGAAPWVLATAIIVASIGFLPILLRAYQVIREREIYEQIRGEV